MNESTVKVEAKGLGVHSKERKKQVERAKVNKKAARSVFIEYLQLPRLATSRLRMRYERTTRSRD